MLAQNFKTADDLKISDIELGALIKVLGMLERGELIHVSRSDDGYGFNMGEVLEKDSCGTTGCLCGWAYVVSEGAAFPGVRKYLGVNGSLNFAKWPKALRELFRLGEQFSPFYSTKISDEQAASALRNYLTIGEPRWSEIL